MAMRKSLNTKEVAVLRQCDEGPTTLEEMSTRFRRAADDKAQANSWARNSVRRPLRERLLMHTGPGTYAITAKGRHLLETVVGARLGPKSRHTAAAKMRATA